MPEQMGKVSIGTIKSLVDVSPELPGILMTN